MVHVPNFIAHRPYGTGYDYSGVIVDGNGTQYKEGDEVYGYLKPCKML